MCSELSRLKGEEADENSTAQDEPPPLFLQVTNILLRSGMYEEERKEERNEVCICLRRERTLKRGYVLK